MVSPATTFFSLLVRVQSVFVYELDIIGIIMMMVELRLIVVEEIVLGKIEITSETHYLFYS